MNRNVIVVVFGATSGLTVEKYGGNGVQQTLQALQIPWKSDEGGMYWPNDWVRAALVSIKNQAVKGDIIAAAMPGADLAWLDDAGNISSAAPVQHYRSVPEDCSKLSGSAEEFYLATGGALVAFFQPFSQILAEQSRRPVLLEGKGPIIPMADWMTQVLLQRPELIRHDMVMLQSQGLAASSSVTAYTRLFGSTFVRRLAPFVAFRDHGVLSDHEGRFIVPVTHDSVPARMVGFSKCPWVLWTGTWIGTACSLAGNSNVQPTAASFKAGVAFEGIGNSRAAITNVAMAGATWKHLIKCCGLNYDAAADCALLGMKKVAPFALSEMPSETDKIIPWIYNQYKDLLEANNWQFILGGFIKSVAKACAEKLEATAQVLGLSNPTEVAVIGGWSKNRAFIKALEDLGYVVIIPLFAADATHAGLAADALVRIGDAEDMSDALCLLSGR